ncbi:hypothetical protein BHM03_00038016, partial [Ensete ventricosum]
RRSGNSLEDHRKLAKGIEGLSRVRRELARSLPRAIRGLLGARRKLGSLPRVYQDLVEGDHELTENASGVRQKMIETRWKFVEGCWEDHWDIRKLARQLRRKVYKKVKRGHESEQESDLNPYENLIKVLRIPLISCK